MIELYEKIMSKAQVDGVKELIDLCHNGYVASYSARSMTAIVFGLRHSRNGRKLTMFIGTYFYEIKENGKILKAQYYNDDGSVVMPPA